MSPNNNLQNTNLDKVSSFINNELASMATNIAENYPDNIRARENNPFLAFEDEDIKKYMAISRSVDSQLGNRIQRIIFYIARLNFGLLEVPNIVTVDVVNSTSKKIKCTLYSVPYDLEPEYQKKGFDPYKQYVYVNKNKTEEDVKKDLKVKRSATNAIHSKIFEFDNISDDALNYINSRHGKKILVDLLFFSTINENLNNVNAFEIKMGGNLDTKNSASNAQEVKDLFNLFSFLEVRHSYFATCYGECSYSVKSRVSNVIGPEAILNGISFWNKIIPHNERGFTYEQFINTFRVAFIASGIEQNIKDL